jgi:hypothetical protein
VDHNKLFEGMKKKKTGYQSQPWLDSWQVIFWHQL